MNIIPVLDVLAGQVVRGIGGRRHDYRPIVSSLVNSAAPRLVAQAFRDHFHLHELYLADLDAIAGKLPALNLYSQLVDDGFSLWVDAGISDAATAQTVAAAGVATVVAGLETVPSPRALADILQTLGPAHVVFSLDLKAGQPLRSGETWPNEAWPIALEAIHAGVRRMLILDLAQVGASAGVGTEALCMRLTQTFPHLVVAAGGGVRDRDDLLRLNAAGVHSVLVASALHDGHLRAEDWLR